MKTALRLLFCAGLLILASGCKSGLVTAQVWKVDCYHSASEPHVLLSIMPGRSDVLVQYDEVFGKFSEVTPRAYWLQPYKQRQSNAAGRPDFIPPETCTNLESVPLGNLNSAVPTHGYHGALHENSASFSLWCDGRLEGVYSLPHYDAAPPVTWWRVSLTPVTVATDAAIVTTWVVINGMGHSSYR
jgi:hypothetical protein